MIKQTYNLTILISAFILLGTINIAAQYDDLYFDEDKALTETALVDNAPTDYVINVDELEVYSEDDEDETVDSDVYDDYFDYQGQDFDIDAYGFTNRLRSLRLSGLCLPRRYNYFELLREAALNPRSRLNAPFLYAGSFAFLSPFAPYRPFILSSGQWAIGYYGRPIAYIQRENRSYNRNNYTNYNAQPRSASTRIIDVPRRVSDRTRLVNGNAPQVRRSSPSRTSSYRDRSSSRNSTAASSYQSSSSNNTTTTTSGSTSKRSTRRP